MAKKRLNKKVALVGSLLFAFLVVVAIGAILYLSRNPEKFIKDGDEAVTAAKLITDEQLKKETYEKAERSYLRARAYAKTDSRRIDILFKLADMYVDSGNWRNTLGCWSEIIRLDPKNVKARYWRLRYVYIMADSGVWQVWQDVASQTLEFIDVAEQANLLAEDMTKWEIFGTKEKPPSERLGPYLYLLRGRAALEITKLGGVTDMEQSIDHAIGDLEKVRELEPNNIDLYWYLAQAVITKGEIAASKGDIGKRDKAAQEAKEFLEQAVKLAPTDPKAHINLLLLKLGQSRTREEIKSLETDYLALVQKFPDSALVFSQFAEFYLQLGHKSLDKVIEAIEKAIELDKENGSYVANLAGAYYSRFSIYRQETDLYKAIELANQALSLPDMKDSTGPRYVANRRNRTQLYTFLANCYIVQVLESRFGGTSTIITPEQKQEWLAKAEKAVYEIEQLYGSGEEPEVIKWRGLLEFAKGQEGEATRKLYAVYQQFKASGRRDSLLSYTLAKLFQNTSELGAANEFFTSAFGLPDRRVPDKIDQKIPDALLDYADVLFKLRAYEGVLNIVNYFESEYWSNERSQTLRIKTYIATDQFDEAEKELAKAQPDAPRTIKLNLELNLKRIRQIRGATALKQLDKSSEITYETLSGIEKGSGQKQVAPANELMTSELAAYRDTSAELLRKLLEKEPNTVDQTDVAAVCDNYISDGKADKVKDIVNRYLEYSPDNAMVLFYKQVLSEPEPDKISDQRRTEIEEKALLSIADPIRRDMSLGAFYRRNNEPNKATVEFKKVFEIETPQKDVVKESPGDSQLAGKEITDAQKLQKQTAELGEPRRLAASYLFEIALTLKDWKLAEQIEYACRRENLDGCEGKFFAARLGVVKEDYKSALVNLDECLKLRPVFSYALLQRSGVNAALGNEQASIDDVQKAAELNPLDPEVARIRSFALYQRNKKLGDNVSSNQIAELKDALVRAMSLNRNQWQIPLQSLYAEFISRENPVEAIALRQRLLKAFPSAENALLLGQMALRMADKENDPERKKFLFDTAASAFEQAYAADPQNKVVLNSYAEYYRQTGQEQKAEALLSKSTDLRLLWNHYFQTGRFDNAKKVLVQLYQTEPKDTAVLKGFLLIAEKTADKEAMQKYSEELLAVDDSIENRLIQIEQFLKIGLIKESEYKLQSFKEKYSDEPRALLLEAWLEMRQGRLIKALDLINRSLEIDQNSSTAWWLRGTINHLMANYSQAIIDFKKSKSLLDKSFVRISLAKAYLRAGRQDDAITEIKSTFDDLEVAGQSRELLENVYLQLDRKADLKKFYAENLPKFPDDMWLYLRAAEFLLSQNEFAGAEQLYAMVWQKSKMLGTGDPTAFSGYLKALLLGGKTDKVLEEAGKYVDTDYAPIAYLRMAEVKLKLGDKTVALEYCRKALDKAGANENFISNILQSMHDLFGSQEVANWCKQRLETDPESIAANYTMFDLMMTNDEYNKASGYIDRCLEIVGPNSPATLNYIMKKAELLQLAYTKTSDNNYLNKAIIEYESLLDKMPNNTSVLNNLAYMLADADMQLDKALRYAEHAHELMPNDPYLLDTYSYVLYKNGKFNEASEYLQSALQQYELEKIPAPAEVYEHLGMINEKLSLANEALAAYEQALEQGADKLADAAKQKIKASIDRVSKQIGQTGNK